MAVTRRKYQGVLNILSFNRHYYVIGLIVLAIIVGSSHWLAWHGALLGLVVAGIIYGLIMPLIVSAYVYDCSGFYDFEWLQKMKLKDLPDGLNVNINAGFDETSYIIKDILPVAELKVYDFYNPDRHTEAAITRARKVSLVYPETEQIETQYIPLDDDVVDHVFLLSSIHEIRHHTERVCFLKECKRICKPDGSVIMVEHLRDLPNFLAFTIGYGHFFSRSTWVTAYEQAGFVSISESKFTPFMSVFKCR